MEPLTGILASAPAEGGPIEWLQLAMGLFGGLALFLYGMNQMSDALKSALGAQMKQVLAKLTKSRVTGALTGAFVTAVIQSSSVTTVLVVSFVSAGLMTMGQSVSVIMGANIGTTITAQIVAFKVEEVALWMIAVGFLMAFVGKRERLKQSGTMLLGLGLIFYGMGLMGDAMRPLRSYDPFMDLMVRMHDPLLAILAGAAFTALVQSSSATTAVVITMAGQGLIDLETGIALAFGANVGTCITALLAALGKPREAQRAAVVHLAFNVIGVVIWLPFISYLASWVTAVSPSHPDLEGAARLAAEVPRQIANAHTLFNVINTVLFLGLTTQLARLVSRVIPDKPPDVDVVIRPEYLDETLLDTPSLALQRVRLEIGRMGHIVQDMFLEMRRGFVRRDRAKLDAVRKTDDQVDVLESEVLRYLGAVRLRSLTEAEGREVALAMRAADAIESVGDVIEKDLVDLGHRAIEDRLEISDTMRQIFNELGGKLTGALEATIRAVRDLDVQLAGEVLAMKPDIDHMLDGALERLAGDLTGVSGRGIDVVRMELTALELLKRMFTNLRRVARAMAPPAVAG